MIPAGNIGGAAPGSNLPVNLGGGGQAASSGNVAPAPAPVAPAPTGDPLQDALNEALGATSGVY